MVVRTSVLSNATFVIERTENATFFVKPTKTLVVSEWTTTERNTVKRMEGRGLPKRRPKTSSVIGLESP